MIRLDKYISNQGLGSRKDVHKDIFRGNVTVNGKIIKLIDYKVDEANDEIIYCGQNVSFKKNIYIMMNKPQGVVSATTDKKTTSVIDIVPPELSRKGLFPAGRLDKDTEGFIIITDDGDFAHKMLAPKNEVHKIYQATLEKPITQEDIQAFADGVSFYDGTVCRKAGLKLLVDGENPLVEIDIHEGKFHQVKKMFFARNNAVLTLKRVCIGNVKLDKSLKSGECREMSIDEIHSIIGKNS